MLTLSSLLLLPSSSPVPTPFNFCKKTCIAICFQYVLKRINLQRASKRERSSAEQEAKLLQKLKHPNIVSYKQSFETPDGMLYIAMQYCEGGDLYTKLKEQKGVLLEERQVVEWFVQIAMALQVCAFFFLSILYRYNCFVCVCCFLHLCCCFVVVVVFWGGGSVCVCAFLLFFALFRSSIFFFFVFFFKKVRSRQKRQ